MRDTVVATTAVAMSGPLMELTAREAELRYARPSHYSRPPPSCPAAQFFLSHRAAATRSKLNEQLDRVKEKAVAAASSAVKEQEEKLARLPSSVGASLRASRSGLDEAAAAAADAAVTAAVVAGATAAPPPAAEEAPRWAASAAAPADGEHVAAAAAEEFFGRAGAGAAAAEAELSTEATLRYQKARLIVLEEELEKARAKLADRSAAAHEAIQGAKEGKAERARLEKSEKALRAELEVSQKAAEGHKSRAEMLERELGAARRAAAEAKKEASGASGEQRAKDVRLNRALEELERHRAQLRDLRLKQDGAGHDARAELQKVMAENNRLKKRCSELLVGFRKQMKLIDVLKRQKLHVEAAHLLQFTEDEFMRTLELGEELAEAAAARQKAISGQR